MKSNPTHKIYSLRNSFSIIGLTGRTGAGVSKVASVLSNSFTEIENIQPLKIDTPLNNKMRRYNISYNYSKQNWKVYKKIDYKNVILIHIIRTSVEKFEQFLKAIGYLPSDIEKIVELIRHNNDLVEKAISLPNINVELKKKRDLKEIASIFFSKEFEDFSKDLNQLLKDGGIERRIKVFSEVANNIRKSGECFTDISGNGDIVENDTHIYSLAETINRIVKGYKILNKETHIVIDSLRNSLEIMFFKERYSAFYMISINSSHRRNFLNAEYDSDRSTVDKILSIDETEYLGKGISEGKFYLQDVQNCIQKSDIHFNHNPPAEDTGKELSESEIRDRSFYYLVGQIIKYTSLILHPGLITPSAQERCMQIAYVAKSNSGCISRQVGAVITDINFSVKSIGWNDVPNNSTPCILKSINNLKNNVDLEAYSPYEKDTKYEFNAKFKTYYADVNESTTNGLNCAYCFKDFHNYIEGKDNQVHTRSLHAEENAMLQISKYGGQPLKNGILFTTASPCELCAKKARQLEITQIYYIDPYPGISKWHILRDGRELPQLILFSGAVGRAYHKLYEPFMSYKDELALLTKKRPKINLNIG